MEEEWFNKDKYKLGKFSPSVTKETVVGILKNLKEDLNKHEYADLEKQINFILSSPVDSKKMIRFFFFNYNFKIFFFIIRKDNEELQNNLSVAHGYLRIKIKQHAVKGESKRGGPSPTLVYVSNLPLNFSDEQLGDLFKGFQVKSAYVAVRVSGEGLGFGFVNLANPTDQQKAIESVDGKEVEGRKLSAKVADRRNEVEPTHTAVFVSNLPASFKDEDLKKLFSELKVKDAHVHTFRGGKSKGFGYVDFETSEDQQKALKSGQKKAEENVIAIKSAIKYRGPSQPRSEVGRGRGREARPRREEKPPRGRGRGRGVHKSEERPKRERRVSKSRQNAPVRENTLYVTNIPFDLEDDDLKSIFNEFNAKAAEVAKRGGNGRSLGFGFVEFNNADDTKNALEALDQCEVNGRVLTIKIAIVRKAARREKKEEPQNDKKEEK